VEKKPDTDLTVNEVHAVCKEMASYKRPSHVEILQPEQMPLNRVAKTDYVVLKSRAQEIVADLRSKGGWDKE
jgi:acyl-CoA synthetase (AMP-forming)/AMP-acid ligase II